MLQLNLHNYTIFSVKGFKDIIFINIMDNKHKYFCDICPKKKNSDIFCSFDKCRDYENHIISNKHLTFCKLVEQDSDSILCKYCNKKFSEKGYKVHKERNNRMWNIKHLLTSSNSLGCNNFIWNDDKRFASFQDLLDYRSNPVINIAAKRQSTIKHASNNFSYLKKYDDKTTEEKEELIEKEEEEYVEDPIRPQLDQCDLCYKYEDLDRIYTTNYLKKWDMQLCDCVEED